jgi:hypothetical protein
MDLKTAVLILIGLVRKLAQVRHAGEAAELVKELDELEADAKSAKK